MPSPAKKSPEFLLHFGSRHLVHPRNQRTPLLLNPPKVLLNATSDLGTNSPTDHSTEASHLDLKQIKQLIDLMKRSELTEFEVEEAGFKIRIKRGGEAQQSTQNSPSAPPTSGTREGSVSVPSPAPAAATVPGGDEAGFAYVKSPMVGTFYRSPSPDNPPYVDTNSKVEEKSVVCIIEAMKIMNEIQAETKGTVVDVLVENGQPVEYGQRLFKIKLG